MADRYWVGGTGTWNGTSTTNWSTTSGGASGASVPTSADNVFFDSNSGGGTLTVSGTRSCSSITFTGFTGTVAGASTPIIDFYGNVSLQSGISVSAINFRKFGASSATFLSNGNSINSLSLEDSAGSLTLSDAMVSLSSIAVTRGTFTTNNYNVTATSISSSNSFTRAINLGSSTVTLSSNTPTNWSLSTNLTLNAGTSQINCTDPNPTVVGALGLYNVSLTNTAIGTASISLGGSYNNLTIAGRTTIGISNISIGANTVINGTLTLSPGTNATMRTFVRSDTIGTTRTLTCAAVASLTDIDFRDITIAGSAAPVSGTRLGDCKGNSGITFDAPKTVYWRATSGTNWASTTSSWSLTAGGAATHAAFPLAQDTAVFTVTYPSTGNITLNASYNIGSIDWSARTVSNISLTTSTFTPVIYGNWIGGSGLTNSGTGQITFAGRGNQTITSVGISFTQGIGIDSPGGSVTLLDALTTSRSVAGALTVTQGTFDANGYNVTLSGTSSSFASTVSRIRTVAIGSGTWTIAGSGTAWNISNITGLTVTGTGTINLSATASRTFAGGDVQTYPTITQSNTSTLTISGSNKFADITNTALGTVRFTGGTTTEFGAFNLNGTSTAARLTVGSTSATQAILKKPTAWNVGTGSLDGGNNTGLSFTAGTNDFLSISGINGVVSGGGIITVYISENALVNSSESSVGSYKSDIDESLLTNDLNSTKLTFFGATVEAIYVSDAFGAGKEFLLSVTESITSTDLIRASSAFASSISEITSSSDNIFARPILGAFVSEIATSSENASGGFIFLSFVFELASSSEVSAALIVLNRSILEAATTNEVIASVATLYAILPERVSGIDVARALLDIDSVVNEAISALDNASTARTTRPSIIEFTGAFESSSASSIFQSSSAESLIASDSLSIFPSVFSAVALAAAQAVEYFNPAGSVYNASLPVESAGITDFLVGSYLWNPIDDMQAANWQNVSSGQTPGWTQVLDVQSPGWVVIPTSKD